MMADASTKRIKRKLGDPIAREFVGPKETHPLHPWPSLPAWRAKTGRFFQENSSRDGSAHCAADGAFFTQWVSTAASRCMFLICCSSKRKSIHCRGTSDLAANSSLLGLIEVDVVLGVTWQRMAD